MSTATLNPPASELLTEFVSNVGGKLGLDKANHVIKGVKLLGLESANGRRYKPEAVKAAIGLYEGAKINVNHPKGRPNDPRDYQDRLGHAFNAHYREGLGIYGDVDYNPAHPVAAMLEHDAEHAPQRVGFSHNIEARTSRDGTRVVVEAISRVQSVDLVADPATTKGLYEHQITESIDMDLTTVTLEQIRSARPDLAKQFVAEHLGSEEAKAKDADLKKLKEHVEKLEGEKKLRDRVDVVSKKLAEAKLPKQLDTELFREQCYAADDATLAKLIEERQAIAKTIKGGYATPAGGTRPVSADQQQTESRDAGDTDVLGGSLIESLSAGE